LRLPFRQKAFFLLRALVKAASRYFTQALPSDQGQLLRYSSFAIEGSSG